MKKQAFVILCAGACIAGSMAITSCGDKGQGAGQAGPMAPQVAVLTVEPSTAEYQSTFPATLRGKTDIDIRPQVSGFITKVHVDEGQHVRKGQTLFTIDQVQFQAAVDQAQANVNSAASAVSTAEITEQNKRMLLDKNIISHTEWQMAANQLAQAKAALAQAQAALTTARKNLSYTTVTAPSDGVVGTIPNREGSLASPTSAQPLTTISDNSEVYAYFSMGEKELLELTDGGRSSVDKGVAAMPAVKLQLADGTIYPYEGKVATVSGVIDNSTGAASARALFPNPSGMLRSGNTGQIVVPHATEGALIIPQRATYELQDLRYVYTLNDSNYTVPTQITVQPYNDGQTFVVTSGLNAGDRIVTEGVGTTVRANIPVTPKTAAPAAVPAESAAPAK
ncbi:MAG: efflux RND transporter periplasmic adaptor subunit [Muribaculaceae bacterium]|nr:efflux RND transporter periplasmic adaptor subunit [Muribaculaceae bacterium]